MLENAIERIKNAIQEEGLEQKIVFILGSGISLGAVPSTAEMTERFLTQLGSYSDTLESTALRGLGEGDRYQVAAEYVKSRFGESKLASIVRAAVFQACAQDATPKSQRPYWPDWSPTAAHESFAKFVATIPASRRGPVFTTNFDPLIEAALESVGILSRPVYAQIDRAFDLDVSYGELPIVHLHGFYEKAATLSTSEQLMLERPDTEMMLVQCLSSALVVVVGYGGWNDCFTRSLARMVALGSFANLNSELLWMQYATDATAIPAGSALARLKGRPGVNVYPGINAHELFDSLAGLFEAPPAPEPVLPVIGWERVKATFCEASATRKEILRFTEGVSPTWGTATSLPIISSTRKVLDDVRNSLSGPSEAVFLLAGATGEGKSLALRQIALNLAKSSAGALILWRQPGSPVLTAQSLRELRDANALTILCCDDADLMFRDMAAIGARLKAEDDFDGKLLWILATHSHYMNDSSLRVVENVLPVLRTIYEGVSLQDCRDISEAWFELDMIPPRWRERGQNAVAEELNRAVHAGNSPTLFGGVLELWQGDELFGRLDDLLDRLSRKSVGGVPFDDLLLIIGLIQNAWDPEASGRGGLTLSGLGALCGLHTEEVVRVLLEPLGREAWISRVGDHVYLRHPAIAEAISNFVTSDDLDSVRLGNLIGKTGAGMRWSDAFSAADSSPLYLAARHLKGKVALAVARGAILGSPGRLEPRVTYLATLRDEGMLESAAKTANSLSRHILEFEDIRETLRGFYVEWATIERKSGNCMTALSLSIIALADHPIAFMRTENIQYALLSAKAATANSNQIGPHAPEMLRCLNRLIAILPQRPGRVAVPIESNAGTPVAALVEAFAKVARAINGSDRGDLRFSQLAGELESLDVRRR